MIRSFRHKGLEELFLNGKTRYINPLYHKKLRHQMQFLNRLGAGNTELISLTPWQAHQLRGKNSRGQDVEVHFSFHVTANWRLVFRYDSETGDVELTDFIDYH